MIPLDRSFHSLVRSSVPDVSIHEVVELENLSALHFHLIQERDICSCAIKGGQKQVEAQYIQRIEDDIAASARLAGARVAQHKKYMNAAFTLHASRRRLATLTSGTFGFPLNPAHLRHSALAVVKHEIARMRHGTALGFARMAHLLRNMSLTGLIAAGAGLLLIIFSALTYWNYPVAEQSDNAVPERMQPSQAADSVGSVPKPLTDKHP